MRHLSTILAAIALLATPDRSFAQPPAPYSWSISDSNTSPFVNVDLTTGFHTVYLWLCSCDLPPGLQDGMAAAEFAIVTSPPGANLHFATNTVNGFFNALTPTNLLLAVGGCPCGPIVAANLLVIFNVPGSMCLAPSATQTKGTVDCSQTPQLWPMDWVGLSVLGGTPCHKGLCQNGDPVEVEVESWGSTKARYHD